MDKNDICFIRAKQKHDYVFEGIKRSGYRIIIPYKDYNLLFRVLRELWFRLEIPFKNFWYNPKIKKIQAEIIIIKDPLIIPEFIYWLKKNKPDIRLILDYDNRVSKTINPNYVDQSVAEKWSYDFDDCMKYGMQLKPPSYLDIYQFKDKLAMKYDILYLGRDKGRADNLFQIQKEFEKLGLKTYFHICADRLYKQYTQAYYKPFIPYCEYLKLLSQSRAILNLMPSEQKSITQREMESVFNEVKCITSNKGIKKFALYHPTRFFVLGEDKLEDLRLFFDSTYLHVPEEQLNRYRFDSFIRYMVEYK